MSLGLSGSSPILIQCDCIYEISIAFPRSNDWLFCGSKAEDYSIALRVWAIYWTEPASKSGSMMGALRRNAGDFDCARI